MKSVIFIGGKEIGYFCLEHLLSNSNKLGIKIIGVLPSDKSISKSNFSFSNLCKEYRVKIFEELDDLLNVDIIISVQFHLILQKRHIEKARQIAVNLHMAPLPEYRGCNQFSFAIIDRAKEFGTSLHKLDASIDGGDLLFERRFEIKDNLFVSDLYKKTFTESKILFVEKIQSIIDGEASPIPQNKLPKERKRGFHLRKEMSQIKQIGSDWSIEKQKRYFRATYFPPFTPPVMVSESGSINLNMDWYNSL